jgi:predicted AlkP superfamily pyrophosphatase or phosphodiesterase
MAGTTSVSRDSAKKTLLAIFCMATLSALPSHAQSAPQNLSPRQASAAKPAGDTAKPKLVVVLVVDQMRGDYIDKFQSQWTGGLKRLVREGAWFHDAAYPYAATETCVGHSTVSTGAFPATHGMIANEWWDRDQQKEITCTNDASVKNIPYDPGAFPAPNAPAAATPAPGDGAGRLLVPTFAEELKFQSGSETRIVTMSLKARAAITLAGHQADSVTWFDGATGAWVTSTAYPQTPLVAEFAKAHPVAADFGKTWAPLLPESAYLYEKVAAGAGPPAGYGDSFPHPLRGIESTKAADPAFFLQWSTSPYAETYLTQMAEAAVDKLHLGQRSGTDFLAISFSSVDYVGHSFGPRSWEMQDELARLDRDLATFFAHLDKSVGRGKYVVAITGDHGVAPIPEDLRKTGIDAGRLDVHEVKVRIEQALENLHYAKPTVADVGGADVYFAPGTYAKLKADAHAMQAVLDAIQSVPGVLQVYTSEEVAGRPATDNPILSAEAAGFFQPRSGDLIIVPRPYWIWDYSRPGRPTRGGTSHGTPYYYDQSVPVILMGGGIRPGKYFGPATPADIAPTLAALCGITLATRDSHVLSEALLSRTNR